jgi:hypothetical protein
VVLCPQGLVVEVLLKPLLIGQAVVLLITWLVSWFLRAVVVVLMTITAVVVVVDSAPPLRQVVVVRQLSPL